MSAKKPKAKRYRCAKTGRFVTAAKAKRRPRTTIAETIKPLQRCAP